MDLDREGHEQQNMLSSEISSTDDEEAQVSNINAVAMIEYEKKEKVENKNPSSTPHTDTCAVSTGN